MNILDNSLQITILSYEILNYHIHGDCAMLGKTEELLDEAFSLIHSQDQNV